MIGIALLITALTAAPPATTEDPAVRVCELMIKASLRAPESYSRIADPRITGVQVTLDFISLDAHRKPKPESRSCLFSMSKDDGRFHVEPFSRAHLERRLEETKAKLRTARPGNETMLVRSEILDINREIFVQQNRRAIAERKAGALGIYPIPPGSTRLDR